MPDLQPALDLAFNPFEPAASGPRIGIPFSPSGPLESRLRNLVQTLARARGPKVIVILGDYGAGKTCLLQWLHDDLLPEHRIRPYYFDNPGVHFYALANTLLRTIGRKDFAKFIWELAGPLVQTPYQQSFFRTSFEDYLSAESRPTRRPRQEIAAPLQAAIMAAGVTVDEQIAHCLARIVTDAVRRSLRYQSFHSHPEARPERPAAEEYVPPARLDHSIDHLRDGRIRRMLRGYFLDMYLCLREVVRVCRDGARVAFVVGNARYDGRALLVDEFTAELGERAGLACREIRAVRWRGNSAQQMGRYGRAASRESVVMFETR